MTAYLVVQGAIFALWAFVAFRCLFRLLALVQARTGEAMPGFHGTVLAARLFWTEPRFAGERKSLLLLTLVLLASSAGLGALF